MKLFSILPIMLLLLPLTAAGEQIYKSVDQQGNVTYSDQPLPGSVEVEPLRLDPEPTAEQVAGAEERIRRTRALADEMQQNRLQQEAAAREQQMQQQRLIEQMEDEKDDREYREYVWGYPVNEYYRRRQALKRKLLERGWQPGSGRPGRPPQVQPRRAPSRPAVGIGR